MKEAHSPERYWLTYFFAVALTAIVALYGAWGWLAADEPEPFKAVLCLVAQGLANGNAVLARRAIAKERPLMGLCAFGLGAGCATFSAISLHHAWTLDGAEIHWAMTAFLALLEPVMFWFVEEVKFAQKPKTAEEIAEATLADLRGEPKAEPVHKRPNLRTIAGGLTGAAAVALAPSVAHGSPSGHEPICSEPMAQKMSRSTARNLEPDRAQAKLLLAQGLTPYAVHKATHVPLSTLKRWAREAA